MVKKRRSSSGGMNTTFEDTFVEKEVTIAMLEEPPLPEHTCFWYFEGCGTRSGECVNKDSPHIICPIKGDMAELVCPGPSPRGLGED